MSGSVSSTKQRRAVILTAIRAEYQAVRAYLTDPREVTHPQGTVYEQGDFIDSMGHTWHVGIVEIGAGNPGAALETERAIAFFNPDAALFVGVAGGLKEVRLCDVVAATKIYGYESGKSNDEFQPRPNVGETSYSMEQRARAEARKDNWLKRLRTPLLEAPRVYVAPIAAGEKVVASERSVVYGFLPPVTVTQSRSRWRDAVSSKRPGQIKAFNVWWSAEYQTSSRRKAKRTKKDTKISQQRQRAAFAFEVLANLEGEKTSESPPIPFPSSPSHNLPSLSERFVTREEQLRDIRDALTRDRRLGVVREFVIYGHNGAGKTSLAIDYGWTYLLEYGGIFFVDCSADPFYEGIANLLPRVLPDVAYDYFGAPEYKQSVAIRVRSHLEASSIPSLLILDDVRNADEWDRIRRSGFLPGESCHRLITTTDPELPAEDAFRLGGLSVAEGIDLLAAHRGDIRSEENRKHAEFILDWLGGVPFFLTIVGVYMRRKPKLTWSDFARSLQDSGLGAIRRAEDAARFRTDLYIRRVNQVLDNLLDSLSDAERRALEYSSLLFNSYIIKTAIILLLNFDPTLTLQVMPGYEKEPARHRQRTRGGSTTRASLRCRHSSPSGARDPEKEVSRTHR